MCLAVPVEIIQISNDAQAVVRLSGVETTISTALIDSPQLGDYVIVHVGYALEKLDTKEAEATLALLRGDSKRGQSTP